MGRKKVEKNPLSADRIKQLCKMKGISQAELARQTHYSAHSISKVASGQVGLSPELAQSIKNVFPDISISWLLGDSDAVMSIGEQLYVRYRDAAERRDALAGLFAFLDFKVSPPFELHNMDDYYYDITYKGATVALSREQLDNLVDTTIDIVQSYLTGVLRCSLPADKMMEDLCDYANTRLDEMSATAIDAAKTKEEKNCIESYTRYLQDDMHSYDNLKYDLCLPGESEKELNEKKFNKRSRDNSKDDK